MYDIENDQIFPPHHSLTQLLSEQSLPPIQLNELSHKTNQLISDYNNQKKKKKKLLKKIENLEKIKDLLNNPQFFDLEIQKIQFSIEIYKNTLENFEENTIFTNNYLKNLD